MITFTSQEMCHETWHGEFLNICPAAKCLQNPKFEKDVINPTALAEKGADRHTPHTAHLSYVICMLFEDFPVPWSRRWTGSFTSYVAEPSHVAEVPAFKRARLGA